MALKIFQDYIVSDKRRSGYIASVQKGDKGRESEGCIFCKVAENLASLPRTISEIPVAASFDKTFLAVNRYPYVQKGHLMVVTKRHILEINELSEEEFMEIFRIIPKAQEALRKEYPTIKGFNVGINLGTAAGASIEHLHIHLVPRFQGENGFLETTASTRVLHETAEETMQKMAKHF